MKNALYTVIVLSCLLLLFNEFALAESACKSDDTLTEKQRQLFLETSNQTSSRGTLRGCEEQLYADTPISILAVPGAYGDSVLAMRFDAEPGDTVWLVEFFVYDYEDGTFGTNDIYVGIRDDSAGYPSTVLRMDTVLAGTFPAFPSWTSVPVQVPVNGDFHVTIATSGSYGGGGLEFILSGDDDNDFGIRSSGTGSSLWTGPRKWHSIVEVIRCNPYFLIKALVCGDDQLSACSSDSCYVDNNRVWKLPGQPGNNILAQKFNGNGDTCSIGNVSLQITWPFIENSLPLYTDSAEVQLYDDSGGYPGSNVASLMLYQSDFDSLVVFPGITPKKLYVDFSPYEIRFDGDYWIGIKSFAPDSTSGLRIVSDNGGGACDYGFAQFSGSWNYVADAWGVNSTIAMSATSEYCCYIGSLITVPTDYPTIQSAINNSFSGDTILVLPGTYYENIRFFGKNVIVASQFLLTGDSSYIASTIIDGNSTSTVVTFVVNENSRAKLIGLTIQNGNSSQGGGIFCFGSDPTISYNRIINNDGGTRGGGIYCFNANPILEHNVINGNTATNGGGMASFVGAPELNSNNFSENSAMFGGALYFDGGQGLIRNTVIYDDSASYGAAIYGYHTDLTLIGMTIINNKAQLSGIIDLDSSFVDIFNSIAAFNNSSSSSRDCDSYSSITFACSNIYQNSGGDSLNCGVKFAIGPDNISTDPLFCNWKTGDLYLNQYSPCTDSNSTCGQMGALGVGCTYLCGDADGDSVLTISDVNFIQQYYFECEQAPFYFSAGDPNCDGVINLADVLYLSEHLLSGGPAPCCP